MEKLIDLGTYIESGINMLEENFSGLWGAFDDVISWTVDSMNDVLLGIPFYIIIVLVALGAYYANAGKSAFKIEGLKKGGALAGFVVFGLFLVYAMDYWEESIQTTTLVIVSTLIALVFGIPLGIIAARSKTADVVIRPILDLMQTMPAFVYLIPAIFFFSVGNTPGVVATVIFSLPPAVRLTSLGIRNVPEDVIEAGRAFGATEKQTLSFRQLYRPNWRRQNIEKCRQNESSFHLAFLNV